MEKNSGRALRRFMDKVAIKRQVRIAKTHDSASETLAAGEEHRFRKHHAMDCSNPRCGLCSSARRNPHSSGSERLTKQERIHLLRLNDEIAEVLSPA